MVGCLYGRMGKPKPPPVPWHPVQQTVPCPQCHCLSQAGEAASHHAYFSRLDALSRLTRLTELRLQEASCISSYDATLPLHPALITLCLCGATTLTSLQPLTRLPRIENLLLTHAVARSLHPLADCSSMHTLELSHCPWRGGPGLDTDVPVSLHPLAHCPQLTSLTLRNCPDLSNLDSLQACPRLRCLALHNSFRQLQDPAPTHNSRGAPHSHHELVRECSLDLSGCGQLRGLVVDEEPLLHVLSLPSALLTLTLSSCVCLHTLLLPGGYPGPEAGELGGYPGPQGPQVSSGPEVGEPSPEDTCAQDAVPCWGRGEEAGASGGCDGVLGPSAHDKPRRAAPPTPPPSRLESLQVHNCPALNPSRLPALPRLEVLCWRAGQAHDHNHSEGLEWAARMPCLRSLSLMAATRTEAGGGGGAGGPWQLTDLSPTSHLTALTHLSLACGSRPSLTNLQPLADLTALRSLTVDACRALSSASSLEPCVHLTSLALPDCTRLGSLQALAQLARLRRLDLLNCRALSGLSPLRACASLTHLRLRGCSALTSLAPLATLTALESLDLGGVGSVTSLAALAACTALTALLLGRCCGCTTSHTSLAALSTLRNLAELDISGCKGLSGLSVSRVACRL